MTSCYLEKTEVIKITKKNTNLSIKSGCLQKNSGQVILLIIIGQDYRKHRLPTTVKHRPILNKQKVGYHLLVILRLSRTNKYLSLSSYTNRSWTINYTKYRLYFDSH